MKKTLLTAFVLSAALWLSGCVAISCEERHCYPRPRPRPPVVCPPVVEVVEVVEVIPAPRPHRPPRRIVRPGPPPGYGRRPRF